MGIGTNKTYYDEEELFLNGDKPPDFLRCGGLPSQDVIIGIDGSTSMLWKTDNGKSKLQICMDCINSIPKSAAMKSLNPVELNRINLMTLSFKGDEVTVDSDWCPMSLYKGIGKVKSGGATPFYLAVAAGITQAMNRLRTLAVHGMSSQVTQIFFYTDGRAGDIGNRELAKELCRKYAGRDGGKVKIFVILIPGKAKEKTVNETAADILDLCDNITVIKADSCDNGLPATFEFLAESVVVGASSAVGAEMTVRYDQNHMKVLSNTPVKNGYVGIGAQNP